MDGNRPQVHWFFQRVKVLNPVERPYFQLPGGLAFLLRRFHLIQPEYIITAGPVYTGFPNVLAELTDGTGKTRWQLDAIPAVLYSAPRVSGVKMKTETAPADQSAYGVNMSAVFKPRSNTVNLFYDIGENVSMRLSGMEYLAVPGYLCPNFIDVCIEGVFIP
jgi:hypothetical protein